MTSLLGVGTGAVKHISDHIQFRLEMCLTGCVVIRRTRCNKRHRKERCCEASHDTFMAKGYDVTVQPQALITAALPGNTINFSSVCGRLFTSLLLDKKNSISFLMKLLTVRTKGAFGSTE